MRRAALANSAALASLVACNPAGAQNVKITPLGSHAASFARVIASQVNEGATRGGKVRATSGTAAFIALVKGRPVYPALSGRTMEFNGEGECVKGC